MSAAVPLYTCLRASTKPFSGDGLLGYGLTFGREPRRQSSCRKAFRAAVLAWSGTGAETISRLMVEAKRVEGT